MKILSLLAVLPGLAGAAPSPHAPHQGSAEARRFPTVWDSAVMGRRILALSKLGTFSTVFPNPSSHQGKASQGQPEGLAGVPLGLMDYVADCEDEGNPTILAVEIGSSFKNVRAGSNLTISMRWTPPYPPAKPTPFLSLLAAHVPFLGHSDAPDPVPYSAANLPRFSMLGYLEPMDAGQSTAEGLATCFTRKHPDAKAWLPGTPVHTTRWQRLVVTGVYWVGGFGDRAYIGWIPVKEWNKVTRDDWEQIRLPGEEKGWKDWSPRSPGEL